jgi:hypothetical protein
MPIPTPEPGLIISYAYLWEHEAQSGREEGRKDRPCVIALAVERQQDGETLVTVLPVTHRPPAAAVEIPHAVKQHLGLDDDSFLGCRERGRSVRLAGVRFEERAEHRSVRLWIFAAAVFQSNTRCLQGVAPREQSAAYLARLTEKGQGRVVGMEQLGDHRCHHVKRRKEHRWIQNSVASVREHFPHLIDSINIATY